jgi:hypothetical protein
VKPSWGPIGLIKQTEQPRTTWVVEWNTQISIANCLSIHIGWLLIMWQSTWLGHQWAKPNALPTPWGIQMWIQVENNRSVTTLFWRSVSLILTLLQSVSLTLWDSHFESQIVTLRFTLKWVGSQIGNLTLDHGKSEIRSISVLANGVRYVVGKLLTKVTISI